MRLSSVIYVSLLLCSAFFFRMFFLSFGPMQAPGFASLRHIGFKRKVTLSETSKRRDLKGKISQASTYLCKWKLSKSKAVRAKEFLFKPVLSFAVLLSTYRSNNSTESCCWFPETDVPISPLRKHLALSILRV